MAGDLVQPKSWNQQQVGIWLIEKVKLTYDWGFLPLSSYAKIRNGQGLNLFKMLKWGTTPSCIVENAKI